MPYCDICGNETKRTFRRKIAGAIVEVCYDCKDLGEPVDREERRRAIQKKQELNTHGSTHRPYMAPKHSPPNRPKPAHKKKEKAENLRVVDNYIDLLIKTRTKNGMSREQFADALKIQRSYYARIEKGTTALPLDLAQKIGKKFNIKLVERDVEEEEEEEVLKYIGGKSKSKESTPSMIYFRKRGEKPQY